MFIDGFSIPLFEGDIGNITKKKLAKYENSRTFAVVFTRLVNEALDYRYDFEGLPDTMYDRVIKQSLLFYGCVIPFRLKGTPLALSGCSDGQALDIYGNARAGYVWSRNGKLNKKVKLNYSYDDLSIEKFDLGVLDTWDVSIENIELTDGVAVYENKTRTPFIWTVIYYAERIADSLRTLDMDRRWLKRPFIPRCEESEAKSFDESLKKFMNNEDFTVALHANNIDKTDIFSVDVPSTLCTSVTQLVEWYESRFKILCGIDSNSQVDKKGENLLTDEVHQNDEYSEFNVNSVIEEMNKSWDVYNKLTGLSIQAVHTKTQQKQEEKAEEAQNAFNDKENNNGEDKAVSGDNNRKS